MWYKMHIPLTYLGILCSFSGFSSRNSGSIMDKAVINKDIGTKIKQVRTIKGWSREHMAELLEMSVSNYGNIERGETDICISRLTMIANIFDISVNDLLGLTEKNVLNFGETTGNTDCLIGVNSFSTSTGNSDLEYELEKNSLLIKERDKEIENLKAQILQLQELNSLLKEKIT